MSKEIDPEKIASGDLDENDILYLQDRGLLPPHITPLKRDPFTGRAYVDEGDGWDVVKGFSAEQLKEFYRRKKKEEEEGPPRIGDQGGVVEVRGYGTEGMVDGEEATDDDYDTWTTEELRDSLRENELVVGGKKQELIERMRRFDSDQLTAEDRPS
ncbi:MAG: hypothetical protein DMF62_04785 [Acidobacteria bacterium]|nr:MAG: hypothetical protein DMF62_04785 [Acidobacteriota bacterium]